MVRVVRESVETVILVPVAGFGVPTISFDFLMRPNAFSSKPLTIRSSILFSGVYFRPVPALMIFAPATCPSLVFSWTTGAVNVVPGALGETDTASDG